MTLELKMLLLVLKQSIGTIGSQTVSTDPSQAGGIIIGSSSLSLGPVTSISRRSVSVALGAVIIDATSTLPISSWQTSNTVVFSGATDPADETAAFIFGGNVIAASPAFTSGVIIDGTTLTDGQAATVSGAVLTAASSGIAVSGSTVAFSSAPTALSNVGAISTIVGTSYAVHENVDYDGRSDIVVDGHILYPDGAAMTPFGYLISDTPSNVVVDGTMHSFSALSFGTSHLQLLLPPLKSSSLWGMATLSRYIRRP
ncbi:MAG: hypothetical protein M1820_001829 [Bogoriella megaspora]|nr:MAG: hypothetical protein M1820_001829 [Bogoriella megaspora]